MKEYRTKDSKLRFWKLGIHFSCQSLSWITDFNMVNVLPDVVPSSSKTTSWTQRTLCYKKKERKENSVLLGKMASTLC